MPTDLAERILQDCRGAVGEVRFGFGSKRQVWAFEERHQLDVSALIEELAAPDAAAFLDFAVRFHDEFAAVSNAWHVRDRIQALAAQLCRAGDPVFLESAAAALVDDHLAVRHWLIAAFVAAPPAVVFRGLEDALVRAYQPPDQWALLARMRSLAQEHSWPFSPGATQVLANLAQFSASAEQRCQALDLMAQFSGTAGSAVLARAACGEADPAIRAHAADLLNAS